MKLNAKYSFFFLLIILMSCSKGKLEYRAVDGQDYCLAYFATKSKQCYLVNTTKDEKIEFTVKIVYDNDPNRTRTEKYTLNPGEETLIGCDSYYKIVNWDQKTYNYTDFNIVGELVLNN